MSYLRKLARHRLDGAKFQRIVPVLVEEVLFGSGKPPTEEHATERQRLCDAFRGYLGEFHAQDPAALWRWLLDERRGYSEKADGPSGVMGFVDSVQALRAEELSTTNPEQPIAKE